MRSSRSPEEAPRVARYFHDHARDFDSIYETDDVKPPLRRWRDRMTRGTVVQRLDFVNEVADRHHPKRVLDVGCGSGRFAVSLAKKGSAVVGLDFAEDMIVLARRAAADAGVADRCTFLQDDFLAWDTDTPFDLALAIGVFDYVAEPQPLLAKLVSVSGGRLIASFPRRLHPLAPLRYVRLRANGCPVHFYERSQVDALAREHLTSYQVVPFHRDHLLVAGV